MRRAAKPLLAVAALALSAALTACAFSQRKLPLTRYYTLAIPGAPSTALGRPVEAGPFTLAPAYGGLRLAYRTSPWRLDYYTYHRWAAAPSAGIAEAVRDYLERAPRADGKGVRVTGHVRAIEELDEQNGSRFGMLVAELAVVRDGRASSGLYAAKEPAEGTGPEPIVAALSRALGKVVDQALAASAPSAAAAAKP